MSPPDSAVNPMVNQCFTVKLQNECEQKESDHDRLGVGNRDGLNHLWCGRLDSALENIFKSESEEIRARQ